MKFYKAVVRYPELYATYRESLGTLCLDTNNKYWNQEDIKVLITKITCDCMTVLCAVKNLQIKDSKVDEKIRCYLKDLKSQSNISKLESARLGDIKEITLNTFAELLNEFSIEKTIEDKEVIRESLGYTSDCILYKEKLLDIVECDKTDKHGYFFDKEEKKRIKGGLKINGPVIAPVHYVIYEKNKEIRDSICKELVSYLWKKGRICNRRIVHVDDEDKLTLLLNSKVHNLNTLDGGVVIVKVGPDIDKAKNVLDIMSEDKNSSYSNKFTIIILADTEDQKGFEKELKRCFSTLAFYPIVNQRLSRSKAMEFFEELLEEDKITVDKSGWQEMFTENEYTYFEAGIIYRKWLRGIYHIHNNFPQYRGIVDNYFGSHEEKGVDGRKKLDDLIGLTPVKSLVEEIIDYYKIQKMRQKMNVQEESSSMHMVFWGNPGTAKTTVARIMAQILKEEGILKKGELIEVGRSDLVGKYVGWTAKSIKEYFDKAKGSVLFIDEAYSLNDEQGSFGEFIYSLHKRGFAQKNTIDERGFALISYLHKWGFALQFEWKGGKMNGKAGI